MKYNKEYIDQLVNEIVAGRRLSKLDDLRFLTDADLEDVMSGADALRKHFVGDRVDLCTIVAGRSGRCSENCKFCAQSAHYHTNCDEYDFMDEEDIVALCKANADEKVDRFSIVTSGKALTGAEFEKALSTYRRIRKECDIKLCASMGFLKPEQFEALKEVGVSSYHDNIETAPSFFNSVCTTHTMEGKLETIKNAKKAGLRVCSGGIIGMGETFEQRIEMAFTLGEISVDSIPINVLMPIKGTPLESMTPLTEEEVLRTIAMFRFINPEADIRLAGGRKLLSENGKKTFIAGANASITGNMLTTTASTIRSDREMLMSLGRTVR